jgi:hypothetical protein
MPVSHGAAGTAATGGTGTESANGTVTGQIARTGTETETGTESGIGELRICSVSIASNIKTAFDSLLMVQRDPQLSQCFFVSVLLSLEIHTP